MIIEIESHINKIKEISDSLFMIRRGFYDFPEAEGSLGYLADELRKEADICLELIFRKA